MKKQLKLTFIILIFYLTGMSAQTDGTQLSLQQCIKTAFESSQSIINIKLDNEKINYQKKEALAGLFPQIDAYATYDDYLKTPIQMVPGEIFGQPGTTIPISLYVKHNISAGFRATQTLYDQTAFTAVSLSKKAKELSEINLEKGKADLIYDVSRLYYLIKVTEEQIVIYKENINRLENLLKITESKYNAGFLLNTDVERVKIDRENLVTEKNNLENLLSQQTAMLGYTIGLTAENKFRKTEPNNIVLTDSLQRSLLSYMNDNMIELIYESFDTLAAGRPEAMLLKKQIELASINENLAIAGYFPTLSFSAQYFYQSQRDKFDFFDSGEKKWFDVSVIGLNLTVPIFDGLKKNSKVNQAEVDYKKASNDYEFARRYFNIELNNAAKNYITSKNAESRQKDNVELAQKVYEQTLKQYQQGVVPLTDLLSVENSMSSARLSLLNALQQLRMAEIEILKTSGKLNAIINQ